VVGSQEIVQALAGSLGVGRFEGGEELLRLVQADYEIGGVATSGP
jgi:hypothetical protein